MGREQSRQRQQLHLCLAAAIVIVGCSCSPKVSPAKKPTFAMPDTRWQHLEPVQARIETRDFEGALMDYQAMFEHSGNRNGDIILFDMALLYSHYANSRREYNKSLSCFQRLVQEFPHSPLAEEAKIWMHLLDTMEKAKRVDIELEEKMKELK